MEISALVSRRFPGLDSYDFGARSLYDVLTREYATQLVRRPRDTGSGMLSPDQAELLGVNTASRH